MDKLKEKGRKMYRDFLREDLAHLKRLVEGMKVVGQTDELLQEYKWIAQDCLRWKRLIKLNK